MAETIFFNVWKTDSPEAQESLLSQMRTDASHFVTKPGFLSLTIWTSQQDHRVLVEGRWASEAHFHAAVTGSAEAVSARAALERMGRPEPGLFVERLRLGMRHAEPVIAASPGVTFIQVWETDSPERQDAWLATMREKVGALTSKPGFEYLGTHASIDGTRAAVYARWRDQASADAAVRTPEAQAGHEALRRHGTPGGTFYRVSDVYLPDRTQSLREDASQRWGALGFKTEMVSVDSVELHVATGGTGRPIVLLHGYPQSGEIWRHVARQLSKTRRVIVPDLRGLGLSGVPDDGYDLPNLGEDIHRLLEKLNPGTVDIAGHDWGGAVAAVYALQNRSRVGRLAFIESALGGAGFESAWVFDRPNPAMTFIPLLLTEPLAETLLSGREEVFMNHLWRTFTHNKTRLPFEAWQPYVDAMKRPGLIRSGASFYRAVYNAGDAVQELIRTGKLELPLLSVSGRASLGTAQGRFVEAFAGNVVKHVIIEDAGHFVAEEQPEAVTAELLSFFGS